MLRKDKKSTSLGIHCGFCGRLRYRLLEHAIKHTTPALSKQSSRSHTPQNRLTMDQSGQLSCQSTLPQDMNCCISALLPGVFAMSTTTTHDFWSGACQTDHHRSSQKSHPSLYQNLWLACLTHGDFHIPKDDESASVVGSGSIETFTKIFKNNLQQTPQTRNLMESLDKIKRETINDNMLLVTTIWNPSCVIRSQSNHPNNVRIATWRRDAIRRFHNTFYFVDSWHIQYARGVHGGGTWYNRTSGCS